jgi:hypothetical protein
LIEKALVTQLKELAKTGAQIVLLITPPAGAPIA